MSESHPNPKPTFSLSTRPVFGQLEHRFLPSKKSLKVKRLIYRKFYIQSTEITGKRFVHPSQTKYIYSIAIKDSTNEFWYNRNNMHKFCAFIKQMNKIKDVWIDTLVSRDTSEYIFSSRMWKMLSRILMKFSLIQSFKIRYDEVPFFCIREEQDKWLASLIYSMTTMKNLKKAILDFDCINIGDNELKEYANLVRKWAGRLKDLTKLKSISYMGLEYESGTFEKFILNGIKTPNIKGIGINMSGSGQDEEARRTLIGTIAEVKNLESLSLWHELRNSELLSILKAQNELKKLHFHQDKLQYVNIGEVQKLVKLPIFKNLRKLSIQVYDNNHKNVTTGADILMARFFKNITDLQIAFFHEMKGKLLERYSRFINSWRNLKTLEISFLYSDVLNAKSLFINLNKINSLTNFRLHTIPNDNNTSETEYSEMIRSLKAFILQQKDLKLFTAFFSSIKVEFLKIISHLISSINHVSTVRIAVRINDAFDKDCISEIERTLLLLDYQNRMVEVHIADSGQNRRINREKMFKKILRKNIVVNIYGYQEYSMFMPSFIHFS